MRALFLALILANLGLFAYALLVGQGAHVDQQLPLLQISPEKIQLARPPVVSAPKPAPVAAKPALAACIEWGTFAGPEVARADAAINGLDLPPAQLQRTVTDAGGYWVYIPPLKTKSEADKKIGELKALGVTDFFVVQDAGQWRFAVSLGIFKSEEAARTFYSGIRDKGVRSAVMERRENFLKQVAYFVREPGPDTVAKITALQRDFAGTEIRAVTCPAGGDAKGA